jgi:uncharacterized protein GlcG (DUF336 family)
LEGAKKVIAAAVAEGKNKNAPPGGAIAVVDEGGNLIAVERLDNTFAAEPISPSARRGPRSCSNDPQDFSRT